MNICYVSFLQRSEGIHFYPLPLPPPQKKTRWGGGGLEARFQLPRSYVDSTVKSSLRLLKETKWYKCNKNLYYSSISIQTRGKVWNFVYLGNESSMTLIR